MHVRKELKDLKKFKNEYLPSNKELIRSLGLKATEGHPDRTDPYYFGDTNKELTKLEELERQKNNFSEEIKRKIKEHENNNRGE